MLSRTLRTGRMVRLLPGLLVFPVLLIGGMVGWIMLNFFVFSQPPQPSTVATTGEERQQQDIDFLVSHLPQQHIDPFYVTNEADWHAAATDLEARFPPLATRKSCSI